MNESCETLANICTSPLGRYLRKHERNEFRVTQKERGMEKKDVVWKASTNPKWTTQADSSTRRKVLLEHCPT